MRFSTKLIIYSIVPAVVLATAALIGVAGNLGAEQRFSRFFESQQSQAGAVNEMYTQGLQMAQAVRNIVLDPTNPAVLRSEGGLPAVGPFFRFRFPRERSIVSGRPARCQTLSTGRRLGAYDCTHRGSTAAR